MSLRHALIACLAGLTLAGPARAQAYRVDDSRSQVLGGTLRLKPEDTRSRNAMATQVTGETGVAAVLDVSPWKGRQARIYLTIPGHDGARLVVSWNTHGRLLPGSVRSGERTLVYAGMIATDTLEDTLRLVIRADGRKLRRDEQLAFAFEIEPGSP